mmetsp:Transcript_12238/g.13776  ORF Transcript_12238/g.13776 Transcript_12238/m.13776 type:complete len:81 (+) Transcript_12238:891-1133(+)
MKLASQSLAYNMNTAIFVNLFSPHFDKLEVSKEKIKRSETEKEIFEEEDVEEQKNDLKFNHSLTLVIAIVIIGLLVIKFI